MHTVILRKKDTSPVRTPVPCGQGQSQFLQSGQSRREAQRQEKPVLPGQQPNGRPEEQQQPRRLISPGMGGAKPAKTSRTALRRTSATVAAYHGSQPYARTSGHRRNSTAAVKQASAAESRRAPTSLSAWSLRASQPSNTSVSPQKRYSAANAPPAAGRKPIAAASSRMPERRLGICLFIC